MAKTQAEFVEAMSRLTAKVAELKTSVDSDVQQVGVLITEIRELIAFIKSQPNAVDFEEQVAAVEAAIAGVEESRTKLQSDNADVEAAIAESNAQVPPAQP